MRSLVKERPHMRWAYYRRRALVILVPFSLMVTVYRAQKPSYTCDRIVSVRAVAGDSLWSIVDDHCKGDINAAVDDAFVINGGELIITIGQEVFLPGKKGK